MPRRQLDSAFTHSTALECGSLLPLSCRPACWPGFPQKLNDREEAHGEKRQQAAAPQSCAEEFAPAGVPSGWLTSLVPDKWSLIGYNSAARSDKALRACRVRYARTSSSVFVRNACLWFLPRSAVEKSRSARARAGRQMGRWADRCRGIGHPLPTASDGPQAGRRQRAPQRLDSSTYRLQNRGNKARMSMKTKDKYKKSLSRAVPLIRRMPTKSRSIPLRPVLSCGKRGFQIGDFRVLITPGKVRAEGCQPHSYLSATKGSTFVARRAGM